jgi:microcystin degradation protein MlrC
MRVGIIALLQESNTFLGRPTTLAHFQQELLATGEEVRRRLAAAHHEVGGFFEELDRERIEAVPIFAARALPYGVIAADDFTRLADMLFAELQRAGRLDGLLVAPHGATVAENAPDADGYWLGRLRETVGPRVPVVATLDLHANLSPRMAAACDAIVAYRTNPHLDQRARGIEAARLIIRTLRGEIRPTLAAAFPPLAVNIERQSTDEPPCREIFAEADALLDRPGALADSILLGFPYADVEEMGAAAVVVTDGDAALAQSLARELAGSMWSRRRELAGRLVGIDESLQRAAELAGPVCLLDMGDNVGGGSPGDGTLLLHAVARSGLSGALACLYDPVGVAQAAAAGCGRRLPMRLGGKSDDRHGPPLEGEFEVAGLFDGKFRESEPRHGGLVEFDQGQTAVVRDDRGTTIMLTSRRVPPFSLMQWTACGIDPRSFRLVIVKGVHAPVAAYRPVARHFLRVNTPGVTTADMGQLAYRHRRRPLFPFEETATFY